MRVFSAAVTLTMGAAALSAQTPAANPADVATIDAIMAAVYDVISGPAGEQRDWDRFRSLFAPGANLIPSGQNSGRRGFGHRRMSVEEYVELAGPSLESSGFFEVEAHRVTEQYGSIGHVFSTYESRRSADDPEPFVRGINSFQLFNDGTRWWVVNIFWMDENSAGPIPAKYLPGN